ncbi:MAG: hypothetical protein NC453_11460 [Muribaculum sp.]|nr:hypothetical protein [Muribaculum sp.]
MANWCETDYTLTGNKHELDAVYDLMHGLETMANPRVEKGFKSAFLGCLVDALGGDWENTLCRGEWGDLLRHDDRITFNTSTTWTPLNEVWDMLCERYPSVKYYYRAEEPGCEIYETNDRDGLYYPERFKAVYSFESERAVGFPGVEAYFPTRSEAVAWIKEKAGINFESTEERKSHLEIYGIDCAIHPIQVITHEQDLLCRAMIKTMKLETSEDGKCTVMCDLSSTGLSEEMIKKLATN